MSAADKRIRDLVKLTKGRSKTDRTLLYRHISHLIIQRRHAFEGLETEPEDTKILFELFDALSRQVDTEIRKELAQDLSRHENPPEELTKRLAIDKISVAEVVLKSAPFKEQTLLNIIKNTGKAHHLVITERKDLSQKLWQSIVDSREEEKEQSPEGEKPEEKQTKTPLIQFPNPSAMVSGLARGKARRAVDLFVPGNDQGPPSTPVIAPRAKDTTEDRAPDYFLGTPPKSEAERQQTEQPLAQKSAIYWSVNRKGEIDRIDLGAEQLFNTSHNQLIGQNLWQLLDININSDIYEAITKHHPIRNYTVAVMGNGQRLYVIGHARFDKSSGRFEGFDGTFKPVEDAINRHDSRRSRAAKKDTGVTDTNATDTGITDINAADTNITDTSIADTREAATGHVLAAHLSADASVPIQDMLEGIQRIARAARRNNDETMLTDIRSVMADCFKLRDMVEDTERIARMFGGGDSVGEENFDVFKVLNSCLDDDTTRHGNITSFQLLPQTTNPMIKFSRSILRQTFARMLEIARESSNSDHLIPIYVHPVEDGRLEVTIPLGALTGDKSVDERELNTDDRLKLGVVHRKRSGDPVMTASLGLSTLSSSIERLGGRLDIVQNFKNSDPQNPSYETGSVSVRLPVS